MKFSCPDCQSQLEEIKACGCRDLFCNSCNQLVSKNRAVAQEPEASPATAAEPEKPTK